VSNFVGGTAEESCMQLMEEAKVLAGIAPEAELDRWADKIVSAAHEVHRNLGPGFAAPVYEQALCLELGMRAIPFRRAVPVAIDYKGKFIGHGEIALLVGGRLVVEVETRQEATPLRAMQLRSQLKATGCRLGLLINFAVAHLPEGVRRVERR
jgi:GxxExxY protein